MEWISVNDKLPDILNTEPYYDKLAKSEDKRTFYHKHSLKVLAYSPTTIGITTAFYWGYNDDPMNGWSIMGVTHWMYLPEEPNI